MSNEADKPVERVEVKVSLDIHGFSCPPDEITKILGISPSRIWLHGEPVPNSGMTRKESHWILDAPTTPGYHELSERAEETLDQVSSVILNFAQLPADAVTQVFCVVYDYNRSTALGFSSAVVAKAAALRAELNIDYYDMTGVDPGE